MILSMELLLLPLLLAPAAQTSDATAASCRPSYVGMSKLEAEYFEGYSKLSASAIVIGCAEGLTELSADEISTIRRVLNKLLANEKLTLFSKKEDRRFREDVATQINGALEREIVADVFFFDLNYAEGM
jgi:hypothetical protein